MRNKRTVALMTALMLSLSAGLSACSRADVTPSQEPSQSVAPGPDATGSLPPEDDTPTQSQPVEETDDPGELIGDREETLTVVIEGVTETIPAIRHNSVLGYAVTYDPALFSLNTVDQFSESYMAERTEGIPNVYLSVSVIEDELDELTFDDVVEGMRTQKSIEEEAVTVAIGAHNYAASYLRYSAGDGAMDELTQYYITEQNGTIFVVALGCFNEGEEGFGARLHAMLDTMTF